MTETAVQDNTVRIEFQQDQYWIDAKGQKHLLEDMSRAHLANVLKFTRSRDDWLYALDRDENPNERGADDAELATGGFVSDEEAWGWLESTPLILAIKAWLEH